MTSHLLDVRNLSIDFHTSRGTTRAVRNVSFHLNRGETLGILGESGSGKSVSTSAIMGLLDQPPARISSGSILLDGKDLLKIGEAERLAINGQRIAMIFQDPAAHLNPVIPVGEQIVEGMTLHGVSRQQAQARALELAERVRIPDARQRLNDYPHQFSGGQRQRIMIAMALGMKPDILIADEPTTALDVTVQSEIMDLLVELRDEMGMSMLLISHDLGLVSKAADRLVVMKSGEVVETGTTAELLRAPKAAYTKQLLASVPSAVKVSRTTGTPILKVSGISKFFGEKQALKDISFDLSAGETLAVVGESGSGKSTLSRILLRMDAPQAGTVQLHDEDLFAAPRARQQALRQKMQMIFQDPGQSLNPRWTVSSIISEPWAINAALLPRKDWRDRIAELLELVGLNADHAHRHAGQFSGGQKQRIAIARALGMSPEILICDEAVSALDASVQAQIMELLAGLQKQLGMSYIFIAHDLPLVRAFADRILVFRGGEIVEQGTPERIFARPEHGYTRTLIEANAKYELSPAA
ncbi:dipeptide ABC transporter ATP-binding protein [Halovulum sp. GXIMD14794]